MDATNAGDTTSPQTRPHQGQEVEPNDEQITVHHPPAAHKHPEVADGQPVEAVPRPAHDQSSPMQSTPATTGSQQQPTETPDQDTEDHILDLSRAGLGTSIEAVPSDQADDVESPYCDADNNKIRKIDNNIKQRT